MVLCGYLNRECRDIALLFGQAKKGLDNWTYLLLEVCLVHMDKGFRGLPWGWLNMSLPKANLF